MKSSPWIVLWSLALVFCDSGLANWLPDTSSLQSVAQMNFINPIRNLFRGNEAEIQALPSTFDTLCSHENDVHPTGSCVNLATCMFSGGTAAPAIANDNCGPLEGVCCTHHVKCGDTMTSRVAFWESDEYPAMSAMSGGCTLTITPSRNVCYIRVEFLDTILTSPRAETCEGNTLTINGQVEGNSGVICGNLNQHKTFIKVNEGMTGVFRVYKDVVMHMDIQDELHKYKIKLTQIKCDQVKSSPIKISRRHSRTFGGIENVSDENEQFSVGEYEGEAEQNRSSPGTEGSSSATPSRVKRQVLHRHHGAKKIDTINEPKKDFSPQSIPNPNDTLALQNQQVLGEWTWLRNMVSSLPSLGNILDPQDSEAAVQPLKFDSLPSNCDPRNAALCLTSNGKVAKNIEALSLLSSRTTGSTATNPRIPVHSSSDTSFGSAKKENVLKQLLGENFSQNIGPDSKLSGSASPPLHSRLSELIRSQISTRGRPRPPLRVETTVNIEEPSSLDVRSPPPTTSEQSPQTVSNSKKIFVEPLESLNGSRYPIASSDQMHEEMNGRPHTYNTTYTEELATSTIHTKNATTDTNKSDTRSVPEGNSTVIADDISLRELKESIDEETEARQAVGDGLSIPRRRPAYGNVVDDGFVVLVSPLEKPSNNDNNYDSTPPRGDLNALAQHVGKLAASNFIANLRQASSTGEAEENDPQSASQNPTVSSRKEKDTSFYGYIVLKNELGEHFFCSATLITPLHALTAASCVMRKGFETKNYKIHAVFNEDDLGDARYRTGASLFNNTNHVRVTQTMFHPMYKHDSLHFDLAVLQLEREMKDCNPVSIARPDTELMGEDITMLGHGARPTPALTFAAYERHLTYITGRVSVLPPRPDGQVQTTPDAHHLQGGVWGPRGRQVVRYRRHLTCITGRMSMGPLEPGEQTGWCSGAPCTTTPVCRTCQCWEISLSRGCGENGRTINTRIEGLVYLHLAACNEFYEDSPTKSRIFRHDFIKPEMLCVLSSEGVQLCEGDQGGPVLVNFDDDRKSPRLVGIASGNDNNCIGVQRKNIGEFPDIAVRLTWPVVEFIEIATAEIFFDAS
ncbi:Serine proteases trypsin domain [Trinorchestia longiramus]|nr:Serine proteases trypsin domain [Trinorchestia longiramus]